MAEAMLRTVCLSLLLVGSLSAGARVLDSAQGPVGVAWQSTPTPVDKPVEKPATGTEVEPEPDCD